MLTLYSQIMAERTLQPPETGRYHVNKPSEHKKCTNTVPEYVIQCCPISYECLS